MIIGNKKIKFRFIILIILLILPATCYSASPEKEWRHHQKKVIGVVQHLIKVGTRYPAYRCGLYVPNIGICFMKVTATKIGVPNNSSGVTDPQVTDIAEVIQICKKLDWQNLIKKRKKEKLYIQSRFFDKIFLRILNGNLVENIAITKRDNFLVLKKLLKEIQTLVDGSNDDKESDVWISSETERFKQRALSIHYISSEGIIIPNKAIVIYKRFPGLLKQKNGEKILIKKLYKSFKSSKPLKKYYKNYILAIGVESANQLLFAKYPIIKADLIKKKNFKFFRYRPKPY